MVCDGFFALGAKERVMGISIAKTPSFQLTGALYHTFLHLSLYR